MMPDPVSSRLAPHERVLWRQPAPAQRLARGRIPGLVFLCLWCVFLGFAFADFAGGALAGVRAHGFDVFTGLLSGAALFVAVIVQFGARELWSRGRDFLESGATHYALTDRRLMIAAPRGVIAYGFADLARMEVQGRDILFDWGRVGRRNPTEGFRARLLDVSDPERIAALIRKTLSTAPMN